MTIAFRWRQDRFVCEFETTAEEQGVLSVFAGGDLIRQEIVRNASAAYDRARDLCSALLAQPGRRMVAG